MACKFIPAAARVEACQAVVEVEVEVEALSHFIIRSNDQPHTHALWGSRRVHWEQDR
jgi:hypothetical protein